MCGVTNYDEKILQQYADDLYRQAKGIIVWTAVRYRAAVFLVSFLVSMAVASSQKQVSTDAANSGLILVLFLTLIGIAAGVDAGRRKAFMLKLQARQILCQRQTEINTWKLVKGNARPGRECLRCQANSCQSSPWRPENLISKRPPKIWRAAQRFHPVLSALHENPC